MAETLRIPHRTLGSKIDWRTWKRYLNLGLIANAAVWGTALTYLQFAPKTYTSDWIVTLPPSGEQAAISLPGVGTSTSFTPAFGADSYDMRASYQYIVNSPPVLGAAAASLNMSGKEFGNPRMTLIQNTTLMRFECEGDTPEEAQLKSLALHKALETRLNELRSQEAAQKEASLQSALASSQNKLINAQQRLSEYKTRSNFSSAQQVVGVLSSIEQLRKERAQMLAQQQHSEARLQQLMADASNSNLPPQQVADALKLQSDLQFQQILSNYAQAKATLVELGAKLTPDNPSIVNAQNRLDVNQAALLAQSQSILGKSVDLGYVSQLGLNNAVSSNSARQQLFQQIVAVQADRQGLQAQAQETSRQMDLLEDRLRTLVQQQTVADNLMRDVQIAEAIFTSTLARSDIRNSNVFGSYPLIQVLKEPGLPGSPSDPKTLHVLLGATLGSLFLTAGILSLWLRQRMLQSPNRAEAKRRRYVLS